MNTLPPTIAAMLDAAAQLHGVAPEIVRAVAWVESRGNPLARSPAGAIGVMQLMPGTARMLGVDPHDPRANIDGGVQYLGALIGKYRDVPRALAAYNWGPGNVDSSKAIPASVTGYAKAVLARALIERGDRTAAPPFLEASPPSRARSHSVCLSPPPRDHDGSEHDV